MLVAGGLLAEAMTARPVWADVLPDAATGAASSGSGADAPLLLAQSIRPSAQVGPVVSILQPSHADLLRGREAPILIAVESRGNPASTVEIFVDGRSETVGGPVPLNSQPSSGFKFDTTRYADGSHKLLVKVTDTQGYIGQAEVSIYISNGKRADTTPPALQWLNVHNGDLLKDQFKFQLKAVDNLFGIKYVWISLSSGTPAADGSLRIGKTVRASMLNQPPYVFEFDTRLVPDGMYRLDARAIDSLNNEGRAEPVTIGIANRTLNPTWIPQLQSAAAAASAESGTGASGGIAQSAARGGTRSSASVKPNGVKSNGGKSGNKGRLAASAKTNPKQPRATGPQAVPSTPLLERAMPPAFEAVAPSKRTTPRRAARPAQRRTPAKRPSVKSPAPRVARLAPCAVAPPLTHIAPPARMVAPMPVVPRRSAGPKTLVPPRRPAKAPAKAPTTASTSNASRRLSALPLPAERPTERPARKDSVPAPAFGPGRMTLAPNADASSRATVPGATGSRIARGARTGPRVGRVTPPRTTERPLSGDNADRATPDAPRVASGPRRGPRRGAALTTSGATSGRPTPSVAAGATPLPQISGARRRQPLPGHSNPLRLSMVDRARRAEESEKKAPSAGFSLPEGALTAIPAMGAAQVPLPSPALPGTPSAAPLGPLKPSLSPRASSPATALPPVPQPAAPQMAIRPPAPTVRGGGRAAAITVSPLESWGVANARPAFHVIKRRVRLAAVAVVLSASDQPGGSLGIELTTEPQGAYMIWLPAGGAKAPPSAGTIARGEHFVRMEGKETYRFATRTLATTALGSIRRSGLQPDDVDLFIPHQANIRIIEAVAKGLGLPMDRMFVNLDRYGNTSAASVPIALAEAVNEGRVAVGDRVCIVAFGAGFTSGAVTVEWTADPARGPAGDAAVRPQDVAVRLPVDWNSVDAIPDVLAAVLERPGTVDVPLDDVVPGEPAPARREAPV